MPKSISFTHQEFNVLWNKIENRYKRETGEKLHANEFKAFVTYLRKFPAVNFHLPNPNSSTSEGQTIYRRYLESQGSENKFPTITLSSDYALALTTYGEGMAITQMEEYNQYLRSFFTKKGNLGENELSLEDIYIEPKFTVAHADEINTNNEKSNKNILLYNVLNWIHGKKISDYYNNILFILGDPGQGKTSFCYRLLYEITGKVNYNFYYCRLRHIDDIDGFYKKPFETIVRHLESIGYSFNNNDTNIIPIDIKDIRNCIFILDGLDEIEKIHNLDKDKFCSSISELTNTVNRPYKLIITSRKEIDTLALYRKSVNSWIINELTIEEQYAWLEKYNKKSSEKYRLTYKELTTLNEKTHSLSPLMKQPILLHIIARMQIFPDRHYNSSRVYDDLFNRLIDRYWNYGTLSDNLHPVLKDKLKTSLKLRTILQTVALELLHRKSTYLSHDDIPEPILNELDIASNDQIEALKTLAISFYFNYSVNDPKTKGKKFAIEFFHKTFGEYLAAEAIWCRIREIFSDKSLTSYLLNKLVRLFNTNELLPYQINKYLGEIITNERENKKNSNIEILRLKERMHSLSDLLIRNDFSSFSEETTNPINRAICVFYGYSSIYTKIGGEIDGKEATEKNLMFYLYSAMRLYKDINLDYFKFLNCNLFGIALNKASFSHSLFNYCTFSQSHLQNCNFSGSSFKKPIFEGATLTKSIFTATKFMEGSFVNAYLGQVNFSDADLAGVDFSNANLTGADFSNANLTGVKFYNSEIKLAKFNGANLMNAIFENAYGDNVDFTNATLINAKFNNSNLHNVILYEADLTNAVLTDADFSYAKFHRTKGLNLNMIEKLKTLINSSGLDDELLER